jgi:tetratricopeptide (TPR) repeat protein
VFGKLLGVTAYYLDAPLYAMFLLESYLNKVQVSPEVMANLVTASRELMLEGEVVHRFYDSIQSLQELPNFVRAAIAPEMVLASVERNQVSSVQSFLPFLRASRKGLIVGGVFANLNNTQDVALKYFERVTELEIRSPEDYHLHLLAQLNLGRANYELGAFDKSLAAYDRIPRSSKLWLDALWESSWAHFQAKQLNLALGKLHSFVSPYLLSHVYPEALLLRSMVLFELCKFAEMATTLAFFYETYKPMEAELDAMNQAFSKNESRLALAKALLQNQPLPRVQSLVLPKSLELHLKEHPKTEMAQQQLSFIRSHYDKSINLAARASSDKTTDRKALDAYVDSLRTQVYERYAIWIQLEIQNLASQISRKLDEANLIEIEMTMGQQLALDQLEDMIRKSQQALRILAVAGPGHEFWPFYNEFWKDEIGYYVVNTPSSCVESAR